MKRVVIAALMAATMLLQLTSLASAADWCEYDPLVKVVTPGGSRQYVHLTLSALGTEHRRALHQATFTWKVEPALDGTATDVTITTVVPGDEYAAAFPTRAVVSTKPHGMGEVLSTTSGSAGSPMVNTYRIMVP
jgi:hypothetical protein